MCFFSCLFLSCLSIFSRRRAQRARPLEPQQATRLNLNYDMLPVNSRVLSLQLTKKCSGITLGVPFIHTEARDSPLLLRSPYCEDMCEHRTILSTRNYDSQLTIHTDVLQGPPATNQGQCCLPERAYRSYNELQHAPALSQRPTGRPRAASAHGRCAWQSRESDANAMMPKGPRTYLRAAAATRAQIQHVFHALQA